MAYDLTSSRHAAHDPLVSAECYWCHIGQTERQPPLGVCADCWVLSCDVHAERSRGLGKWRCFDGVAQLLTVGAGLEDEADDGRAHEPPITDPDELAERFPALAARTSEDRARWTDRRDALLNAVAAVAPDRYDAIVNRDQQGWLLLAHAIGLVEHFRDRSDEARELTFGGSPSPNAGRLGDVIDELERRGDV
jgi:hypothetical protein